MPVKAGRGSVYSLSNLVTNDDFKDSEAFTALVTKERPRALMIYIFFVLFTPLVFRYAMYSAAEDTIYETKLYKTGNATIDVFTNWACEDCDGVEGVTLQQLDIEVKNVTSPDFESGFPSIAVFASQDMVNWYNFYSTMTGKGESERPIQQAYITKYDYTRIGINQTQGTSACLGGVYNNYLVACLNVQNIASQFKKGEPVRGPPFNDRCFQVEGICGIPCTDLEDGQYPDHCQAGYIHPELLVSNNLTFVDQLIDRTYWGSTLTIWDWIILLTIFLDTLGNIMRFLPVVTGKPTEMESSKSVTCSGTAVLGCTTPIVAENEAIFLRSLIGRTLTVMHTVGSRHKIKGLYVDTILNEMRNDGADKRLQMWCAWMQFVECLAKIPTKSMRWERNLYDENLSTKITTEVPVPKGKEVFRHIHYKKNSTAYFDVSNSHILFPGITPVHTQQETVAQSEEETDDDEDSDSDNDQSRSLLSGGGSLDNIKSTKLSKNARALGKAFSYDAIFDPKIKKQKVEVIEDIEECSLYCDMQNLFPLICFLNGWLEVIKVKDGIYNYKDKSEALRGIFNDAPYKQYFEEETMMEVQDRLLLLFSIFNGDKIQKVPDMVFYSKPETNPHKFMRQDDYYETMWTVTRMGCPDWQIAWSYYSRARLFENQKPEDVNLDHLRLSGTRIKKGSIVFNKIPQDISPLYALDKWFNTREHLYRVVEYQPRTTNGMSIKLEQWPLPEGMENMDPNDPESGYDAEILVLPIESLELIERNKGKAGALNCYLNFLRYRAAQWSAAANLPSPVQTFAGIVDARHMLAMPEVYWNEGLPYFSKNELADDKPVSTILVQYPQFFSNITRDDFLDNKNSGYYTIWQTLRDCAKVCTSSGTNAIWDITDVNFDYATTSRIEDTATTQQVLAKYLTVHVPCFVAFGIAKDTEDYIEAVYRWSTGAVELFWSTLFSHQFSEFMIILLFAGIYSIASFVDWVWAYYAWVAVVALCCANGYYDTLRGVPPLRQLCVSSVVVMNSMYWISNLSSLVWVVLVPFIIAFLSLAPLGASSNQALTWAFIALVLRFPTGLITDRIINLAKFLLPKTVEDGWNYNMVLWRSSQLYVCSFAYTALSLVSGTRAAFRARFFDGDNTFWSSFKISDTAIAQARRDLIKADIFSHKFFICLRHYLRLQGEKFLYSFTMPGAVTTWLAVGLYLFQISCIIASIAITNASSAPYILTTIIVAGVNVFLVGDIAMLLFPSLGDILGRPVRLEYFFGIFAFLIICSLAFNDNLGSTSFYKGIL